MIKTSDFARMQGVTPRAVRKLLQTYASELEGHYEKKGQNGTWIDDFSQEFLRSKMLHNPIVVYDESTSPLFQENQVLNAKVDQLKDALSEAYKALADERAKGNETLLQLQIELAEYRLLAAGREEAEQKAADLERQAISAIQAKLEAELALTAAEEEKKTLSDVADINFQEAEKAKAEAAELKAELDKLKRRNLWQRIFNKE